MSEDQSSSRRLENNLRNMRVITEVQKFIDQVHSFDLILIGAGNVSYSFDQGPYKLPIHRTLAMVLGDAMADFEAADSPDAKQIAARECLKWINNGYAEGVVENREHLRNQVKECIAKREDLERRLAESHQTIANLKSYMKFRGVDPDADKTLTGGTEQG